MVFNVNPSETVTINNASDDALSFIDELMWFRDDYRDLLVHTKACYESAALLNIHHILIVTGAPGMGKTFLCQQLLLQVCDENQCNPFQPAKPKHYLKWCNTRERQAFLMNDVFGASSFNQAKYDAWKTVFPRMLHHLKSLNTYLLFACRENILKAHLTELMTTGIFDHVINLSDEKYQLTDMNKIDIFLNHTQKFKIDIKYKDLENALSQGRDSIGFPQRIHFFCSMVNVSKAARMRYFNHPMEYLSTVIASYRECDHIAYCVLILLLVHDGELPVSFMEYSNASSDKLKRCLHICDIPATTMGALRSKADSLCNSLLLLDNDRYVYQHSSVMEAVTLDFGQRYPADIVSSCSVHFLLERVFTTNSAPSDNEYVVLIQPVMFPQLCARLVKELTRSIDDQKVSLRSLASYAVMKDDLFIKVFLEHLQGTDSYHLLLMSSSPHSQHPNFLFLAAASGQDVLVHTVLTSHFRNVQKMPGFCDHIDRIMYAACNSGSPATVRALLADGARADFRTAHSPHQVRDGKWDATSTCTTLMHATYSNSVEVLRLILDRLQQQRVDMAQHICIRDCMSRTAVHWGALGGRGAATLQILLEIGADIHARDEEGHTSFHFAAKLGDEAAFRALLEAGADIQARDNAGQTALHCCARHSNVDTVHMLLKAGVDVHEKDNDGLTALHCAADGGNVEIVRWLVTVGSDIHLRTSLSSRYSNFTPLEIAVSRGHTDAADFLIKKVEINVFLDRCSLQILIEHVVISASVQRGNNYVVALLPENIPHLCVRLVAEIQRWVCVDGGRSQGRDNTCTLRSLCGYLVFRDPYFVPDFHRYLQDTASLRLLFTSSSSHSPHPTFLFLAAALGQEMFVREALSFHLRDMRRLSEFADHLDRVLYASCYSGSPATVRALLATGARAEYGTAHYPDKMKDEEWDTIFTCTTLMHAAYSGSADVLRLVIDHLQQQQVDVAEYVNFRDGRGNTALHWWAEGGREADALQILMVAGVDVNARDELDQTTLLCSAHLGDVTVVRALLGAGANITLKDNQGQTALHWCAQRGDQATVRTLLEAGDDVNTRIGHNHSEQHKLRNGEAIMMIKEDKEDSDELCRGPTVLHVAAAGGHTAIARMLVEWGADIFVRASTPPWYTDAGYIAYTDLTPLEVAVLYSYSGVADFFRGFPHDKDA